MAKDTRQAVIRSIAEVPWRQFPNHHGGALSKPLVMPQTAGCKHLDYRISIYHVLEGEGLMRIDGKAHVVRKHDVIFLPPGVKHDIANSGLVDLALIVVTSPVTDAIEA
jgi:mannose-6-phosphate isomerase-like protein (cupin superfamily)